MKQQMVELLGHDELSRICGMKNAATQLLRGQGEKLRKLIEGQTSSARRVSADFLE